MPSSRGLVAPDRHAELIARALAHIEADLAAPLGAGTLADKAAMSRHHFHRVFHAYVGCSVGAYVTWRRLQRACALLVSGDEPVLDVALSVGFESAQALAKATGRELGTTPTALREGDAAAWKNLLPPWRQRRRDDSTELTTPMDPVRFTELPEGLSALTAAGRGMVDHSMSRAAKIAFGELVPAIRGAGLFERASSWMSLVPDDPQGPDDPHCVYLAGAVFGFDMASGTGRCERPEIALSGTLTWVPIAAGRCAVFLHRGPYERLHATWDAIYRDWLPGAAETLRDAAPMELMLNSAETTRQADLLTEIWIPI